MISEVNNELFTLCEDAVTEIVEPFLDKMRLEYDPDTPNRLRLSKKPLLVSPLHRNLPLPATR